MCCCDVKHVSSSLLNIQVSYVCLNYISFGCSECTSTCTQPRPVRMGTFCPKFLVHRVPNSSHYESLQWLFKGFVGCMLQCNRSLLIHITSFSSGCRNFFDLHPRQPLLQDIHIVNVCRHKNTWKCCHCTLNNNQINQWF